MKLKLCWHDMRANTMRPINTQKDEQHVDKRSHQRTRPVKSAEEDY